MTGTDCFLDGGSGKPAGIQSVRNDFTNVRVNGKLIIDGGGGKFASISIGSGPTGRFVIKNIIPSDGYVLVMDDRNDLIEIHRADGFALTILDSAAFSPDNSRYYDFKLIIDDSGVHGYVDEVLFVTSSDKTYSSGYVLISAGGGSTNREALSVNEVWELVEISLPPSPPPPESSAELKIISYNIRNAQERETEQTLSKIADFIANEQPDVVGLQEVEKITKEGNIALTKLKQMLSTRGYPMEGIYASRIPTANNGELGQIVLSKHPILNYQVFQLNGNEEIAQTFRIDTEDLKMRFFNYHPYPQNACQTLDKFEKVLTQFPDDLILGVCLILFGQALRYLLLGFY